MAEAKSLTTNENENDQLRAWRTYCSGIDKDGVETNLHGWSIAHTLDEARDFAIAQQLELQGIVTTDWNVSLVPTEIAAAALLYNTQLSPDSERFVWNERVAQQCLYVRSSTRLLTYSIAASAGLDRILRKGGVSKSLPFVHLARKIWTELTTARS